MAGRLMVLAVLLAAVAAPLALSVHKNDGVFVYTLDDPYIHLALAGNIRAGHYGINPGEPTSPASSVIWPLILVPFADLPFFTVVPLALNLLFAGATVLLLLRFYGEECLLCAVASVFAFSLPGLVLTGMEHSFQVFLTVVMAAGACSLSEGRGFPRYLIWAAIAAPLVRYECLAVTIPVLGMAFMLGERKKALIAAGAAAASLGVFSLFLLSLGLSPLPASVLAKSSVAAGGGVFGNLVTSLSSFRGMVQALLLPPLLFAALRKGKSEHRLLAASAAVSVALHLAVGRFGWFHRYGVYMWVYSTMVVFHLYRPFLKQRRMLFAVVLLAASGNYLTGYLRIPFASGNIYRQQYQTARLVGDWVQGPVAVNDLGLVALYSDSYVLDLWGLAVPEALEGAGDQAWVDSAAAASGVNLAVVYPDRFEGLLHWERIAVMELQPPLVVCADGSVEVKAAPWADADSLYKIVEEFSATLPDGVEFTGYR